MSALRTILITALLLSLSLFSSATPLTMVSELSIKAEVADDFLVWVYEDLNYSREFEGNIQFDIYVDPKQSGKVLFIERWESKTLQDQYTKWRAERGDFIKMQNYLSVPPKMTTYTEPVESHK